MWSSPGLGCARRIHLPGSVANKGACGENSISAASRRRRGASASAYMRSRLVLKPRGGILAANRKTTLTTRVLWPAAEDVLTWTFCKYLRTAYRYCGNSRRSLRNLGMLNRNLESNVR